jgi:hypothetical protein
MRVLICGGRHFSDYELLSSVLDHVHHFYGPFTEIIHGSASGADTLADRWGEERGISVRPFPADWAKHGRSAGPLRNEEMVTRANPKLVVAFPGGKGTEDMVRRASAHLIPTIVVTSTRQP